MSETQYTLEPIPAPIRRGPTPTPNGLLVAVREAVETGQCVVVPLNGRNARDYRHWAATTKARGQLADNEAIHVQHAAGTEVVRIWIERTEAANVQ